MTYTKPTLSYDDRKHLWELKKLQPGRHRLHSRWDRLKGINRGWLTVDHKDGNTNLSWTTDEHTHNRAGGVRAKFLTIDKKGELTFYMESMTTLVFIKWDYFRGGPKEEYEAALNLAYDYYHQLIIKQGALSEAYRADFSRSIHFDDAVVSCPTTVHLT